MKKFLITIALVAMLTVTQVSANKYNEMGYIDVSGMTISDLAQQQGITVEEFLEMYSLPADMPADTTENAAYYNIPTGKIAEMYGMSLDELKQNLNLGDDVTAQTPWGIAEGEVLLGDYIGSENVEYFKAEYGFGDEVTAQTKWKEVRTVVDETQKLANEMTVEEPDITVGASDGYYDDNDYNKYNEEDVINVLNGTLQDIAGASMMNLDEFKTELGLPEDMPGNTNMASAIAHITIGKMAADQGISVEEYIAQLKQIYKGEKELTADTYYSEFENYITLRDYFGEDAVDESLAGACLGENVTRETLLGDVRIELERKMLASHKSLQYFTGDEILVMVNGQYIDFDVVPAIQNDRVMVPMRAIFEALGASVNWMGETQTIFAVKDTDIVTMQLGQDFFFKNEEKIALDAPSYAADNRTFVPVRAIAEALGTQVYYNANTRTVVIH